MDECTVCLDFFDDPRVLPCGHSFCLKCLNQLPTKECPEDRLKFHCEPDQLPKNWVVIRIMGDRKKKEQEKVPCGNCDKEGIFWCVNCEAWLCLECKEEIHKSKMFQSHKIQGKLEKKKSEKELALERESSYQECPQHAPEIQKGYCKDCKLTVCLVCIMDDHKSHDTLSVVKRVEEVKQELRDLIEPIATYSEILDQIAERESAAMVEHETKLEELRKEMKCVEEKINGCKESIAEKAERKERALGTQNVLEGTIVGMGLEIVLTPAGDEMRSRIKDTIKDLFPGDEMERELEKKRILSTLKERGISSPKKVTKIIVRGAPSGGPKCNGVYKKEPRLRNGKTCFTRSGNEGGAIYFDGEYWRICQIGKGVKETGWNFSQKPLDPLSEIPVLGSWEAGRNIKRETKVDYSNLFIEADAEGVKREESIIVSGAVGRDCNGTYIREPTPRNGKACYSRGSCGAIYFDGIYWKICQVGVGLDETGWNYSQRPSELSSATPPLGCWESGRNISGEMAVDYTDLSLSSSFTVIQQSGKLASIRIKNAVGRDCNGFFAKEKTTRNGKSCFSRNGGGCIYFDGSHWRICQIGNALDETGWNYSQLPKDASSLDPPMGQWAGDRNISSETQVEYTIVLEEAMKITQTITSKEEALKIGVTMGFSCDECKTVLRMDTNDRYRCEECPDFDFCSKCFGHFDHIHSCFTLLKSSLEGPSPSDVSVFSPGDRVRIRSVDISEAKQLLKGHGGWVSDMADAFGKVGVVVDVLSEGKKIRVTAANSTYVWNPALLTKVSGDDRAPLKVGDRVRRNPAFWKWGQQDGGAGNVGAVVEGVAERTDGWVRVKWPSGRTNVYRFGAEGAYDLLREGEVEEPGKFQVGSKVTVTSEYKSISDAKRGPLKPGEVGVIVEDDGSDTPYKVSVNGSTWWYKGAALCLSEAPAAPSSPSNSPSNSSSNSPAARTFQMGDRVRIQDVGVSQASTLMEGHGGWVDSMADALGHEGLVTGLLSDTKIRVAEVSGTEYVWNAALLDFVSRDEAPKRLMGALVTVVQGFDKFDDAADGPLKLGDTGVVVADDGSDKPYKVKANGQTWWYKEEALKLAEVPSHDLIVSDFACPQCHMLGPSPQSSKYQCKKCKECAVCCGKSGSLCSGTPDGTKSTHSLESRSSGTCPKCREELGTNSASEWGCSQCKLCGVCSARHPYCIEVKPSAGAHELGQKPPLNVGDKVRRNPSDWKWGNQDGGPASVGSVTEGAKERADGWVRVRWPNGKTNVYRYGASLKYDVVAAGEVSSESKSDSGSVGRHNGRIGACPNGISRSDGGDIVWASDVVRPGSSIGYTYENFKDGWEDPLDKVFNPQGRWTCCGGKWDSPPCQ